jgi:acetoin utilization deacetylase AcuC-like enzyme
MGFCLFNNVAIAALHARAVHGLERIAIVDWDVHHGNGTEEIFWEDPGVFYVSTHQYPFYPGTGALEERGGGEGSGYTLNIPLPAGADDDIYLAVFEDLVAPALRDYQPQLLLISAGYDAHYDDPLASMRVTTTGFGQLASIMRDLAAELCDGRLVFVLEGGYNLAALGASAVEVCNVFCQDVQQLRDSRSERNSE